MFRLPLHGVRVLDLSLRWPAEYAARLLADMGAEVIRVRKPAEAGISLSSSVNNRNKYGGSLDTARPDGRALLLRLLALSDVLIQTAEVISYDEAAEANPELIVVTIESSDSGAGVSPVSAGMSGAAAAGAVGVALWDRRATCRGLQI